MEIDIDFLMNCSLAFVMFAFFLIVIITIAIEVRTFERKTDYCKLIGYEGSSIELNYPFCYKVSNNTIIKKYLERDFLKQIKNGNR